MDSGNALDGLPQSGAHLGARLGGLSLRRFAFCDSIHSFRNRTLDWHGFSGIGPTVSSDILGEVFWDAFVHTPLLRDPLLVHFLSRHDSCSTRRSHEAQRAKDEP
jgi:hypothetical protein